MLREHAETNQPHDPAELPERLLTTEEVRLRLGIGRTRLYALLGKEAAIPTVRIGRLLRVRPADLEAFIEARAEAEKRGEDG